MTSGQREIIRRKVEVAMAGGQPRNEAFYSIAEMRDLRPGLVAATYWRSVRERDQSTNSELDADTAQLALDA